MQIEERIDTLEREINVLKERNSRVEAEKAWEISYTRMFFVAFITYVVAAGVLYVLGTPKFLLGALVPAAGYILSMQSLPAIKRWWMKRRGEGSKNSTKSLFSSE